MNRRSTVKNIDDATKLKTFLFQQFQRWQRVAVDLPNDGSGIYTDISNRPSPIPSEVDNDSKIFDSDSAGDLDLVNALLGSTAEKVY